MTQDLKNKILETIHASLGHNVSPALILIASDKIEELVDEAFIKAITEACNIGEVLRSCGLKITS